MKLMHYRNPFSLLILTSMLLFIVTGFGLSIHAATDSVPTGQVLYTQYSLFYEKGHYYTTNYRKGTLLPVNTKVTFVKSDEKTIDVTLPDGQNLLIVNIKDYSGQDIPGILERTFSSKPVNLSVFNGAERKAIMAGEVNPGMSKKAVIVALGYPPVHKTPSLDLNQWRYWQNRFGTFLVHFANGRVVQVQQ